MKRLRASIYSCVIGHLSAAPTVSLSGNVGGLKVSLALLKSSNMIIWNHCFSWLCCFLWSSEAKLKSDCHNNKNGTMWKWQFYHRSIDFCSKRVQRVLVPSKEESFNMKSCKTTPGVALFIQAQTERNCFCSMSVKRVWQQNSWLEAQHGRTQPAGGVSSDARTSLPELEVIQICSNYWRLECVGAPFVMSCDI